MAMNSIGLNLLLQASPQQVQDLLQGLQPGTVLRGRIVDLLPQGKAVIHLQGQNLLAQLPPQAAGAPAFQKGDVLSLEVSAAPVAPQTAQNPGAQSAPPTGNTQALTLRLLPTSVQSSAPAGSPPPVQASPVQGSAVQAKTPLPPQAVIEQALTAAKVPVSSATIAAAKVLAAHGLPLDTATLQSVVQIADSLLAAEQAQASSAPSPNASSAAAPSLPLAARTVLQEALPALRLAIQSTPAAAPRLALQQALSLIEAALEGSLPAQPASSIPQSSSTEPLPAAPETSSSGTQSSVPSPAANVAPSAQNLAPTSTSVPLSTASLLPSTQPIASLSSETASLPAAVPSSTATSQPAALPSSAANIQPAALSSAGTSLQAAALPSSALASPPASLSSSAAASLPAASILSAPSSLPAAPTPSTLPAQATAPSLPVALQAVIDSPSPATLQALQTSISNSAQSNAPVLSPSPPVIVPATAPAQAYSPAPMALPARREAAVLLIQSFPPQGPGQAAPTPKTVSQAARALVAALEDPQSPPAQTLIRAVQAQFPEAKPAQILRDAQDALQAVAQHFDALPAERPLPGPQGLAAELEAANLPVPQQSLQQLPRETIYEAVAWLKTRGLPPQRPLVEAAAQFLSRGQAALDLAEQAARTADSLPEGLLALRPGLKQAFADLDHAIQRSTLKLDGPDLSGQLKQWPKVSGLDLEQALFQALEEAAPQGADLAPAATPSPSKPAQPSLREALAQVQHEVKQALREPTGAAPNVAPKLEQAASDAGRALQSLNALPLQAQPAPSFQTVTLPLALPLQGPLNSGQLSVSWRQGQERQLNDKEPVNVAVALNTESLGEIRVLLQVWKGAVSASVKTEDKATADFLASGAAELKQGFSERTPFQVRALDFGVVPAGEPLPDMIELSPLPQAAGVNLSA